MHDDCEKYLRPLIQPDIRYVADRLRKVDIEEIKARHGNWTQILKVLELSVALTPEPETFTAPGTGEPVAILGIVPPTLLGNRHAVPWMVGTDRVAEFPRPFIRGGRQWVRENLSRYGKLVNVVDSRNLVSVRWLKHIGFTLEAALPVGPYNTPFHRFEAVSKNPAPVA